MKDPLFHLATPLTDQEIETTSKKILELPDSVASKNKFGISRSPTPSDSESDLSVSEESSDSDTEELDLDEEDSVDNGARRKSVRTGKLKPSDQNLTTESKNVIKDKTESYMSKSERICNEAKLAMQTKLMYKEEIKNNSEQFMSQSERMFNEANLAMQTKIVNAKINRLCSNSDVFVAGYDVNGSLGETVKSEHLQDSMFDPLKAGSFDPGPENFGARVAYLQSLKQQLELLKQKQRALKEQESAEQRIKTDQASGMPVVYNHVIAKGKETFELKSSICDPSVIEAEMTRCRQSIDKLQHEKNELEKQRSAISWTFAELEHQVQKTHQDEQLRFHQHFLIQEQVLGQTLEGRARREELFKQFVVQQQLLIAQQNVQLNDLRQKHLKEVQHIEALYSRKNNEISHEKSKLIESQRKLSFAKAVSPTKTDHSITSILNHHQGNDSSKTLSVKDGIKNATCDTCRFLMNYGIIKRSCQKCELLRSKYGAPQQQALTKSPCIATETYSNNLNDVVSKLSKRCKSERACDVSASNPRENISSGSTVTSGRALPYTVSTSVKTERLSQGSRDKVTNSYVSIPGVNEATVAMAKPVTCRTYPVAITVTQAEAAKTPDGVDHTVAVVKTEKSTSESDISSVSETGSSVVKSKQTDQNKGSKHAASSEKLVACPKPIRSHSQSEIYGKITAAEEDVEAGSRHIRSHSQSEANSSIQSDLELTPTKSDDSLETTTSGRKRKVARCLSVPGWFGKGLNIKRKKR